MDALLITPTHLANVGSITCSLFVIGKTLPQHCFKSLSVDVPNIQRFIALWKVGILSHGYSVETELKMPKNGCFLMGFKCSLSPRVVEKANNHTTCRVLPN